MRLLPFLVFLVIIGCVTCEKQTVPTVPKTEVPVEPIVIPKPIDIQIDVNNTRIQLIENEKEISSLFKSGQINSMERDRFIEGAGTIANMLNSSDWFRSFNNLTFSDKQAKDAKSMVDDMKNCLKMISHVDHKCIQEKLSGP